MNPGNTIRTLCTLVGVFFFSPLSAGDEPSDSRTYTETVKPLIQTHCIECHGPETQEGDLRLDTLQPDFRSREAAAQWVEVMNNLNLGEMPPPDSTQPPPELVNKTTDWISGELRRVAIRAKGTGGRVLMRRLNRAEYSNIVRDLLAVEFLPGEGPRDLLPPDGTMNGFDTVSKALLLDPSLMEKYFDVAAIVASKAVVAGPPPVPTRRNRMEYEETSGGIGYIKQSRETIVTDDGIITMAQGMRSDENLRHPWNDQLIPIRGRYRLRVRVGADAKNRDDLYIRISRRGDGDIYFGKVPGTLDQPQVIEVERAFDVPGSSEIGIQFEDAPSFGRVNYHFSELSKRADEEIKAGNHQLAGRMRAQLAAQGFPNQGRQEPDTRTTDHLPRVFFDWIELEGPLYEQWPPKSTELIFHRGIDSDQESTAYAQEIFERLLPRAFRRPVDPVEVDRIVRIVESEIVQGEPFPEAIKSGIIAMLCSPAFLLVTELTDIGGTTDPSKQADGSQSNRSRPLNDHELAFRLSLFLWSSLPDDELVHLRGLNDPEVLSAQVDRMLADPKSSALVDGFARQWLKADQFDRFAIDRNLYRDFFATQNAGLNEAINAEPIEFFRELLRTRGDVRDFLDSDWTMANGPLARHYGIEGISGPDFVRVALPPESHRGGLTTMAAVHKWGSDGNRTKPVDRGKYVLDVLFNDPPKPPPPNVGEVEPNVKGELLTVRQRLDQHRTITACANCHRTIDPYGLALENFGVTSRWRTKQDGERSWWPDEALIDASGTLPNGVAFETVEEYRAALRAQDDRFLRGLAEKMFTYALGRIVEPSDHATMNALVQRMKSEGHTLPSLIKGIVLTDAFLTK